ncbi:indolepyruvate ferredoxin oxidoreductase beta subunit [Geothermobacter ehrlichii]|uniref:Indolepyruvate ferredoxin oxidoreductase beta subunit n=1 Tax=Geothermobacter ehrlichii TaxID=213224 RepID=A0A5D3WMC3_9BACT|nr:indolepyruvate oxidoreductase subunit beta [Geothermobacter ehrlichii]TYP00326.1 indolepyruvate ferredoxin oxidoreductase beta subunit [Geothermobacter ehrlichii]
MVETITNIYLVGVGGQGILLASEILSEALMLAGHDVKKAEVHGMAQRGGSVVSHVRFGSRVYSPIIPEGEGDILFGFELLETYRHLHFLRPDGRVIVNDLRILPPGVNLGLQEYPDAIAERISEAFADTTIVDAASLATKAGSERAANTVLLGALSRRLELDEAIWRQAITHMVPEKFRELNLRAFELGRAC